MSILRLFPGFLCSALAVPLGFASTDDLHPPKFLAHSDYQLAWQEEFDGPAGAPPDPKNWAPLHLGPRRDAINVEEAARLDGEGHLRITTTRLDAPVSAPASQPATQAISQPTSQPAPKFVYHTGMISTQGKYEPRYGYLECRYQAQQQPGHWSAFWLQTPTMGNPMGAPAAAGVEIDVQEYLATPKYKDKVQHTLHWDGYGKEHKSKHVEKVVPGLGAGFHTFGVEWTPTEYIFYTDGVETGRMTEAVSQRSEYLILSVEVGNWADDIAAAKLPDAMVVDYVRVWQRSNGE